MWFHWCRQWHKMGEEIQSRLKESCWWCRFLSFRWHREKPQLSCWTLCSRRIRRLGCFLKCRILSFWRHWSMRTLEHCSMMRIIQHSWWLMQHWEWCSLLIPGLQQQIRRPSFVGQCQLDQFLIQLRSQMARAHSTGRDCKEDQHNYTKHHHIHSQKCYCSLELELLALTTGRSLLQRVFAWEKLLKLTWLRERPERRLRWLLVSLRRKVNYLLLSFSEITCLYRAIRWSLNNLFIRHSLLFRVTILYS